MSVFISCLNTRPDFSVGDDTGGGSGGGAGGVHGVAGEGGGAGIPFCSSPPTGSFSHPPQASLALGLLISVFPLFIFIYGCISVCVVHFL